MGRSVVCRTGGVADFLDRADVAGKVNCVALQGDGKRTLVPILPPGAVERLHGGAESEFKVLDLLAVVGGLCMPGPKYGP